ncbi:hypothetical protein C5D25_07350 [Rathayibacter sp. AY1D7]|uniref:hypothetical protein n=1 Tax=Rathayibacter sp. AY1D7 TaxID=2080547 RepID=UPI000CE8D349|nr:hypothetical protein [Rathayibacter sp. AY1D7]PPH63114.1 hypothetical protein C5D25_07350 [Rathayibacter sp. AY1D7]
MTNVEHHLVTVSRLWTSAPSIVGIFSTLEEARAVVAALHTEVTDPDQYGLQTWVGTNRLG